MEKFFIKTYFDFPSFQRHVAKELLEKILNIGGTSYDINSFGVSETSKKLLSESDHDTLSNILVGYPRYFSGKLFLFEARKNFTVVIDYLITDFLTINVYFNKEADLGKVIDLFKNLVSINSCIFGALENEDEYEKKHNFEDDEGEERLGESLTEGLPGLYKCTYLRNDIMKIVDKGFLDKLYDNSYQYSDGWLFESKINSVEFPSSNNLFFNINTPYKKRTLPKILSERIKFLQSIDRKELPEYINRGLHLTKEFIAESTKKFTIGNILDEKESLVECEDFIISFLTQFKSDRDYVMRIAACGEWLSNHWSKQYGLKQTMNLLLISEKNKSEWTINPFNVVALLFEDHMELNEMESYLKNSFKLKSK